MGHLYNEICFHGNKQIMISPQLKINENCSESEGHYVDLQIKQIWKHTRCLCPGGYTQSLYVPQPPLLTPLPLPLSLYDGKIVS